MTKRDFFRIIIKLFGLYSAVITLFTVLPQNISNFISVGEDFIIMLWILISLVAVISLFLLLLFKSDFIIDKLKLDKGFDDDKIELGNLNNESIFKFAVILIGGFLIVENIPHFIQYTFSAFKSKMLNNGYIPQTTINYFNWFISGINILIGYIFITNYKRITSFLDKQ